MATTGTETVTIVFARWAKRRPGWNDYYSVNFVLPWGEAVAIGAPTIAMARDYALSERTRFHRADVVLCILPYRGHTGA